MNRRDLIMLAAAPAVAAIPAALPRPSQAISTEASPRTGQPDATVKLSNQEFQLSLAPGTGLQCHLIHLPSGRVLARGAYFYSFGSPLFTDIVHEGDTLMLRGSTATGITLVHRFVVGAATPWIEEDITIGNRGLSPLDLHDIRCGFVLPMAIDHAGIEEPWASQRFTAVPFRREPRCSKKQYSDFSMMQILSNQFESELWSADWSTTEHTLVTPAFAAEGWIWSDQKGGFLISKYATEGMEFSMLDRMPLAENESGLRWGGIGIHLGQPEHGARIMPGESHRFGTTRLTPFKGGMQQGFYSFRREMEQRGHGCPPAFDPPVHWNELYDSAMLTKQGDWDQVRKKYFTLRDMKSQASKARDFGCEALYLDPGWDTNFASKIWDESRLGSYKAFTEMLARDYGLKCSLHTPLSGWCNPSSYPRDCYRMDRFGDRAVNNTSYLSGFLSGPICGASRQYNAETAKRLKVLARDGAAFFMFDGTMYNGECWDPGHGHAVPARLHEHVEATCRLARTIHAQYPDVLIEMHDPVTGGSRSHASPIYFGHGRCDTDDENGRASGFDSVWAFELMWNPMDDLLSGRAIALYYYNLAYSLPLYIHIDLRTDNLNTLVFWWNASTCRHLGIGGTHADRAVVHAHKMAMKTYRCLKPYYARGTFYGIDEMTHVHTASDGRSATINCFNLEDRPVTREIQFTPSQLGLAIDKTYHFRGASFHRAGDAYRGEVSIRARGHTLLEVS